MSGKKSKPSKTGAEKVEVPEVEIDTIEEETIAEEKEIKVEKNTKASKADKAPKDDKEPKEDKDPKDDKESNDSFSSKVSKYMNKSANKKKRSVDPIIAVSAAVLIICCAVVIGYTIYDKCFADHTQPNVEYGDTVEVEYVGSFYIYYDQDGSVIFDTNIKDVAENTNYKFSYEWSTPTEYELYSVTVGSGGALSMFEDALIGHHPGETVRVMIPAGEGYELKGGYHEGTKAGNIIDVERVFDNADAFKSFFGVSPDTGVGIKTIQSPYGWYADYSTGPDSRITVTYKLTASDIGKEFTKEGSDIKYKVTEVTADEIEYEMIFTWEGKMIKSFDDYGNTIYITGYDDATPTKYQYKIKTGDTASDDREVSGATLFFVIKIVQYPE